jgi:hypothetical protein
VAVKLNRKAFEFAKELVSEGKERDVHIQIFLQGSSKSTRFISSTGTSSGQDISADCAKVNSADPREALGCATGSSAGA